MDTLSLNFAAMNQITEGLMTYTLICYRAVYEITLSKKRNATVTATGCIFISQYMNVVINQTINKYLVNQKQPFENSIATKTPASLKVPPVAGTLCMLWP